MLTITAANLALLTEDTGEIERICPVSGARCRTCGTRPERCPPAEVWTVVHGAAFCLNCTPDELAARKETDQ